MATANAAVHAWDYRRYILRSLPKSFKPAKTPASELAYTRRKIESNFSNFSAWHSRTKLLGSVWEQLGEEDLRKERDKGELDALEDNYDQ